MARVMENGGRHLVVLVHGLGGMAKIFDNFEKIIKAKYSNDSGVTILKCNQSAHLHTVLNIDVCGRLIADEIDEAIAKENVSSLSVIGYSIGGLIARYAAGILFARQLEGRGKHVELGVFTTFACPNLGLWTTRPKFKYYLQAGTKLLSATGKQLMLQDDCANGRPLLPVLADPQLIFMASLRKFKHCTLYANVVNDNQIPYESAAIIDTDPYRRGLAVVNMKYDQGYTGTVGVADCDRNDIGNPSGSPRSFCGDTGLAICLRTALCFELTAFMLGCAAPVCLCMGAVEHTWIPHRERTLHAKFDKQRNEQEEAYLTGQRQAPDAPWKGSSDKDLNAGFVSAKKTSSEAGPGSDNPSPQSDLGHASGTLSKKRASLGKSCSLHKDTGHYKQLQISMMRGLNEGLPKRENGQGWRKHPVKLKNSNWAHWNIVRLVPCPRWIDDGNQDMKHWVEKYLQPEVEGRT